MTGSAKHRAYDAVPTTDNVSEAPGHKQYLAPETSDFHETPHLATEDKGRPLSQQQQQANSPTLLCLWRWELATFLLGTGAFFAILGLLIRYHNKPPPVLPFGSVSLQLTAVVAALTQVVQSALMVPIASCIGQSKWKWYRRSSERVIDLDQFDQASRGPDGSIRLLWHLAWRQRLVSLGALATVLMLLFATFVQQAIQIGNKPAVVYESERAKMPVARNITEDMSSLETFMNGQNNASNKLDPRLNAAIIRGIQGYQFDGLVYAGSASGVEGQCSTSNSGTCEWGAFYTLALCWSSSNISDQVTKNRNRVTLPALEGFLPKDSDPPAYQSGSYIYAKGNGNASALTTSTPEGTNMPNLAEVYYLYYDECRSKGRTDRSNPSHWTAFKGTFQMCMKNLSATMDSRYMTDTYLNSSTTALMWYKNMTNPNAPASCTKMPGVDTPFCVDEAAMELLSSQMSTIFNASASYSSTDVADIQYSTQWAPFLTSSVVGSCVDGDSPEKGKRSWGGGRPSGPMLGFNMTLEDVANSLSDTFRYTPNTTDFVLGTYTYSTRLVLVDFRWFILPAIVYLITAVFVVGTVLTTTDTPVWKSNPLPLLWALGADKGVGSIDGVRKEIGEGMMRLRPVGQGWQLEEERA